MPLHFDCLAHIPFVQLQTADKVELKPGELGAVPFEQWLALEDPSFGFQENRYSHAAPVFFQRSFELDEETDPAVLVEKSVRPALKDDLERLSVALLFTLWNVSLPGPEASATYISLRCSGTNWRQFGPNERELLFEDPSDSLQLDQDQLVALRRTFSRLTSINVGAATPELLRVVDAMKVAARPGLTIEDAIVHFVSVQEDLLNTGGRAPMGKLGETFSRRSAFLYCDTFDSLSGFQAFFRDLYAVRSDVLHGRAVAEKIRLLEQKLAHGVFTFLLFMSYRSCCHIGFLTSQHGGMTSGMSRLVRQIDSLAEGDGNAFQQLKESLQPDWLRG